MEDQRIGVWPQPEAWGDFSLFRKVQTGSEEISFSCLVGIGRVFPPMGWGGGGLKLITHLHLVPSLRMSGATSPLFHTPSWCGKAAFGWNCEVHINVATRAVCSALWDLATAEHWSGCRSFRMSADLKPADRCLTTWNLTAVHACAVTCFWMICVGDVSYLSVPLEE